jgi:hypothetical protein
MRPPLSMDKAQPLNKEKSILLINLTISEDRNSGMAQKVLDEIKGEFLYNVYKKRVEVMKLPLKMTPEALLFLLSISDRAGHVTCFIIDCLELQRDLKKETLTLSDIVINLYPWGFYTEEAFIERIDEEIKQGKSEFSFVY